MKKNAFRKLPLIKRNDTVEINLNKKEESKIEIKPIKDIFYFEFLRNLTVSKVLEFTENCKIKQFESLKRNMKLKKSSFLNLMKKVFLLKGDIFDKLYEQIFNRFKVYRVELTCINNRKESNYFINKINPEDEIDIYEICCALACFVKCDFKHKIKLLFDITDIDDDGFINEKEVKKLIFTINNLFCEESNNNDSSIASQSIASIHSNNIMRKLLSFPGELGDVFHEQKYINFNQFLTSFTKLYNYKYDIIPLYINIKVCLNVKKKEKVLDIQQKNLNDYSEISNDIINQIKTDTNIGASNIDFKKNLIKKKASEKPFLKSSIEGNIEIQNNNNIKNIENTKFNDDIYSINLNKIRGLEVYPGRIVITENNKNINSQISNLKSFAYSRYRLSLAKNLDNNNKKSGYLTFNEIMNEIQTISNKHKADEQIPEQMLAIEKSIEEDAADTRVILKDRNPNGNLQFGLFKRKKKFGFNTSF